jgi:hypothetical protein
MSSNLIREDRASARHFQFALLQAIHAGEGAAFMSEEVVLEQCFRKGHIVDALQRHGLTRTSLVDGADEEFLARAVFAQQ